MVRCKALTTHMLEVARAMDYQKQSVPAEDVFSRFSWPRSGHKRLSKAKNIAALLLIKLTHQGQ